MVSLPGPGDDDPRVEFSSQDLPASHSCTFRVGRACFALHSSRVVEVLRGGPLAPVPRAPAEVLGLLHLRGRIVPVIDPSARLRVVRDAAQGSTVDLVIALGDEWYALRVDEMLDVIEIPPDWVQRPTSIDVGGDLLAGVYASPTRLVHLLDPERMIHALARQPNSPPPRLGAPHVQDQ